MPVGDYNKTKPLDVQSVSGTPAIGKAIPIICVDGDDSTTGTGDIVIDFTNIADAQDIAVYDNNDNLVPYEIESLDTTNNTAVLWVYDSWVRDGSTQTKVAYGDNSANTDRQNTTGTWNNTGQNADGVWHLSESSGSATESSGNGVDGSVSGASQGQSGDLDGGYGFDGTDDYIDVGTDSDYDITTNDDFTIVGYAKPQSDGSSSSRAIISSRDTSTATTPWGLSINNGNVRVNIENSGFKSTAGGNVQTGVYQQIAGTFDGNEIVAYLDGSSVSSQPESQISSSGDRVWIGDNGAGSGTWPFDGQQDEVRIYPESKNDDWLEADFDASPAGGQTFFSQQAAQQNQTDQTATVTETTLSQTTQSPSVDPTNTVTTPETTLTQTTNNPGVSPGTAPITTPETALAQTTLNPSLVPGTSTVQTPETTLSQTTQSPAVDATFTTTIPETTVTQTTPAPSVDLGQTIIAPETTLAQTTENPGVTAGTASVTIQETTVTVLTPEFGLNRQILIGTATTLSQTTEDPSLVAGNTSFTVTETTFSQTTPSPGVSPGSSPLQITPPTTLSQTTEKPGVNPRATDLSVDETSVTLSNPDLDVKIVLTPRDVSQTLTVDKQTNKTNTGDIRE